MDVNFQWDFPSVHLLHCQGSSRKFRENVYAPNSPSNATQHHFYPSRSLFLSCFPIFPGPTFRTLGILLLVVFPLWISLVLVAGGWIHLPPQLAAVEDLLTTP